jgi:hypothetical protein
VTCSRLAGDRFQPLPGWVEGSKGDVIDSSKAENSAAPAGEAVRAGRRDPCSAAQRAPPQAPRRTPTPARPTTCAR